MVATPRASAGIFALPSPWKRREARPRIVAFFAAVLFLDSPRAKAGAHCPRFAYAQDRRIRRVRAFRPGGRS